MLLLDRELDLDQIIGVGKLLNPASARPAVSSLDEMKAIKAKLARQIRRPSPNFRGLLGLAFALDGSKAFDVGGVALLPNEGLRIWGMLDGRSGGSRGVLFSELRMEMQHQCVLNLIPSVPTYDLMFSENVITIDTQRPRPLPKDDWQLRHLAAQMDWLMAATAANAQRQGWEGIAEDLFTMEWVSDTVKRAARHRPSPEVWGPVPYVRSHLDARTGTCNFRNFPLPLRVRFMDQLRARFPLCAPTSGPIRIRQKGSWLLLSQGGWRDRCLLGERTEVYVQDGQNVLAGDPLACDWPEFPLQWDPLPMYQRWHDVVCKLGWHFEDYFATWWERQRLEAWLPFPLASCGSVSGREIAWDFVPGIVLFFDDVLHAYIVPPLFPRDVRFQGELAHGVNFDLRGLLA